MTETPGARRIEMPPAPEFAAAPAAARPAPESAVVPAAAPSLPDEDRAIAPEVDAALAPGESAEPRSPFGTQLARTPLHPAWPSDSELGAPAPLWKRSWVWIALTIGLFAGGWMVGGLQQNRTDSAGPSRIGRALRALGIGGAHFDVMVNSRPEGAWIAVDGKDLARRTPSSLDLPAGNHVVTLSFSDLGGASYRVTGERGQQLSVDAPLWGSLLVREADSGLPVTVQLDGRALGYAPVMLDSVLPGPHELRFTGPGMVPWGQTVEVRVRQQAEVIARPMTSPATGVIETRAVVVDEQGEEPLNGGEVWIDGELRGRAPLTLELPRGPHSVRVNYHGESSPVQVIDLPGGNQRFANFEFGTGVDRPRLTAVGIPERTTIDQPVMASAALNGVSAADVKEMWLHVRTPDGTWRRYQMEILKSALGSVGASVYPTTLFDDQGASRYYMSALTSTGDEYFTEIATLRLEGARPAGAK
jgi:hypothetical protein